MWWNNSIASRVSRAIKQRVADAQKAHDDYTEYLREKLEEDIEANATKMVNGILGK